MQYFVQALAFCGRQGRWVLPVGLAVGALLPMLVSGIADPFRSIIAPCIWLLLFLAVLRLSSSGAFDTVASRGLDAASLRSLLLRVLLAQLLLPVAVYMLTSAMGIADIWCIAATLVAAASPISGGPSLVLLIRGDGVMALRWLIAGTLLLPLSCLPVLLLVFNTSSASGLLLPSLKLALLILSATLVAVALTSTARRREVKFDVQALDGASAIVMSLMVIGLMSALHAPDTSWHDVLAALFAAVVINTCLQALGTLFSSALKHDSKRIIGTGAIYGNRNIALFLTALPALFMEPLLLFIACYQIPMYLTPLVGGYFYRRLE